MKWQAKRKPNRQIKPLNPTTSNPNKPTILNNNSKPTNNKKWPKSWMLFKTWILTIKTLLMLSHSINQKPSLKTLSKTFNITWKCSKRENMKSFPESKPNDFMILYAIILLISVLKLLFYSIQLINVYLEFIE